ncbi:MAG: helix-turn-helix domain-containing protein [bacterium]
MNFDIPTFLKQFGLSEIESKLYLGLLELQETTILELSKYTKLKRTTVHTNIENLIDKGLIIQSKNKLRRSILPETPEKIVMLLEQKKRELNYLETKLPHFIKEIEKIKILEKPTQQTNIKYYQGINGVRSIYKDVVKTQELRSYVNISKIFEMFPENPQLFPSSAKKGNLKIWKEIVDESSKAMEYIKTFKHHLYQYKFFPKKWNVSLFDYMIYDGNIAIISGYDKVSGVVICNKSSAENAKVIFDMMWDLLPTP